MIDFNFESDWLRGRREFCGPITGSKTKTILDDFRLPLLPSPNQAKSRLFFRRETPKVISTVNQGKGKEKKIIWSLNDPRCGKTFDVKRSSFTYDWLREDSSNTEAKSK